MGFEIPGFKLGTQRANAALPDRYRFVTINSTGKIAQVDTAGAKAVGVLQSPTAADEAAELMVTGVSKVVAGAAITEPVEVTSDNLGRAVAASTPGHSINGIALETATEAGEVIAVLIGYGGVVPA